jgi:hypothetical protein
VNVAAPAANVVSLGNSSNNSSGLASVVLALMTAVHERFEGISSDLAVAAASAIAAAGISSNGSSVSFYSARSNLSECDSFGDDVD